MGSGEGGGVAGKDVFSGKETLTALRRGSSGILFDMFGKLTSAGFSFCSVFHGMTIVRGMTTPWKMSMKRKLSNQVVGKDDQRFGKKSDFQHCLFLLIYIT